MSSSLKIINFTKSFLHKKVKINEKDFLKSILEASDCFLNINDYSFAIEKSLKIIGKRFNFSSIKIYKFDKQCDEFQLKLVNKWTEYNNHLDYDDKDIEYLNNNFNYLRTLILEYQKGINKTHLIVSQIKFNNTIKGFAEFTLKNDRILCNDKIITLLEIYMNSLTEAIIRRIRENEVEQLIYLDSLTDLSNRRYFNMQIEKLMESTDYLPISLIVADINGLKLVNDSFGHTQGDQIIKLAVNIILSEKRENDILCRWGGDEFVAVLPNTNKEEVKKIIKNITEKASNTYLNFIPISISIASSTSYKIPFDFETMFKDAEDQMYKVKTIESASIKRKIINSVLDTLYCRSNYEKSHSKRVSELCAQIAYAFSFDDNAVRLIRAVGLYHDIGKITIHDKILNKPGPLTNDEYNEMKRHSDIGYRILSSVNEMSDIADFILKHHERIDGKGYPYGIKGDEIPIITKILSVAEAYDTMSYDTIYKKAMSQDEIIEELIKNSCTQFDPTIVRTLVEKVLKKPWYSVMYGVNNTVINFGTEFDPLEGVVVEDPSDPNLSTKDINITGHFDTNLPGSYELIYSITNKHGKTERLLRKISVGKLKKLDVLHFDKIEKIEIDGSNFDYNYENKNIKIDLRSGGSNNWSSQIIFPRIYLEKNKKYVISFECSTNVPKKELHLSVGYLDVENSYWHSFIDTSDNKFLITPQKLTYKLLFKMEKETHFNSDIKFEFGTGENIIINLKNVELFEFD